MNEKGDLKSTVCDRKQKQVLKITSTCMRIQEVSGRAVLFALLCSGEYK